MEGSARGGLGGGGQPECQDQEGKNAHHDLDPVLPMVSSAGKHVVTFQLILDGVTIL